MVKESKQRFVLNLKLDTGLFQEDILAKRFEIGLKMYNAVLGKALKRYLEINTREVKASQFNHLNRQYNKKKLSQRWNLFEYKKFYKQILQIHRECTTFILLVNCMFRIFL